MNINKEYYIDTLTILSCIAVVYLHANGIFWTHPSGRLWLTSNVIESFFYFAVPVFFMISGATLLEYRQRYSTLTFIKKRFSVSDNLPNQFSFLHCYCNLFIILIRKFTFFCQTGNRDIFIEEMQNILIIHPGFCQTIGTILAHAKSVSVTSAI